MAKNPRINLEQAWTQRLENVPIDRLKAAIENMELEPFRHTPQFLARVWEDAQHGLAYTCRRAAA